MAAIVDTVAVTFHDNLRRNEVHVWLASLSPADNGELSRLLSEGERDRASQYRFERDQRRFKNARGILRQILGEYSGTPPDQVLLSLGEFGKPELAGGAGRVLFNVSHSGDAFALAITSHHEVGIDLECLRPMADVEQVAAAVFSTDERHRLQQLRGSDKLHFFFRVWTAKEALLKAAGTGLTDDLPALHVINDRGSLRNQIVWAGKLWNLSPVPLENDLVASIALEDANPIISVRQWPVNAYRPGTVPNSMACETDPLCE